MMNTILLPKPTTRWLLALLILSGGSNGCSIKRLAVDKLGNALAGSQTTFASDDDPELIKGAAPFSLKLMESLLNERPQHRGLLFAAASGFTQYGYAFVQQEAEELEPENLARARELQTRARALYLRARDYGLRGLETRHAGFRFQLQDNAANAVATLRKEDVPLLYWSTVSWAAAIALAKDQPDLVADLPRVEAMADRALALNESWDHGAIHAFLIVFEMSRASGAGDWVERARRHFHRAVELSGGKLAGPYLSFAESVCIEREDRVEFEKLLRTALAIPPDAQPSARLANLVMQRRARWLLARVDKYFLPPLEANPNQETK